MLTNAQWSQAIAGFWFHSALDKQSPHIPKAPTQPVINEEYFRPLGWLSVFLITQTMATPPASKIEVLYTEHRTNIRAISGRIKLRSSHSMKNGI